MSVQVSPKRTAPRVPPRRKKPRRTLWRGAMWPLIKFALVVAVVVVVMGKVVRPFRLYDEEYRAAQKAANDLETFRRENAMLERRIKYLQTSEGAAQAARKLGWVKPGEITLVLPSETEHRRRK